MKNALMNPRGQQPSATNHASGAHLWIFGSNSKTLNLECTAETRVLSADEQERARRYRSPDRKLAFVKSRSGIRQILSGYLKVSPAEVRLGAVSSGRPVVTNVQGQELLSLSISHTGGLVALAVAPAGFAVGVDIEDPNNLINEAAIRRTVLTDTECGMIDRCVPASRRRLMLQIWTAKETAFKATGGGPSASLMDFVLTGDVDSLRFEADANQNHRGLILFSVAPHSVQVTDPGALSTAAVVGSLVHGQQISGSGPVVRSTGCFTEVAEKCERIVAELASGGVQCMMSTHHDQ
jgi:phosphopantetheinyl transferase